MLALPLLPFAGKLTGPPDSFRFLPRAPLRWLLVGTPEFHFPENALALHLLLQRFQGLIDIIVANDHLDDG